MCNQCLVKGLWCAEEQKVYDNFVAGFVKKKKRFTAPTLVPGATVLGAAQQVAQQSAPAAAQEQPQEQPQQQQPQQQKPQQEQEQPQEEVA